MKSFFVYLWGCLIILMLWSIMMDIGQIKDLVIVEAYDKGHLEQYDASTLRKADSIINSFNSIPLPNGREAVASLTAEKPVQ